jgi:hypothetical protein
MKSTNAPVAAIPAYSFPCRAFDACPSLVDTVEDGFLHAVCDNVVIGWVCNLRTELATCCPALGDGRLVLENAPAVLVVFALDDVRRVCKLLAQVVQGRFRHSRRLIAALRRDRYRRYCSWGNQLRWLFLDDRANQSQCIVVKYNLVQRRESATTVGRRYSSWACIDRGIAADIQNYLRSSVLAVELPTQFRFVHVLS